MSVAARRLRRLEQQPAAGGGFAPTDITGCIGWYDASDSGSFTYHSGTLVSQWDDLSGSGNHLVSASSGVAPDRTGTFNGLAVVAFSSDILTDSGGGVDSQVGDAESDFSFAVVYTTNSTAGNFLMGATPTSTALGFGIFRQSSTNAEVRARNSISNRVRRATVPADDWRTLIGTVDASSSGVRIPTLRANGTGGGSEFAAASSGAAGTFAVGAREAGGAATLFAGSIAEMIFYDNIISGTDVSDLETYLQDKWATW